MSLSNYYLTDQDVRTTSTVKGGARFGQTASTADGRTYAFGFNNTGSGTALAPGKLMQGAVTTSNHLNQTGVALAVGVNTFTYTIGNTAVTANQYQDGYFFVNDGTTTQTLLINAHNTPSGNGTLRVELKDAITVATTTSSKFSLQPNPWSAALLMAHGSSTSVLPAGVPNVSIPDQSFGWFQIGGPCATLINGTPGQGVLVIPSATTDGAVDVYTNAATQPTVGYMMMTGVSTKYDTVYLAMAEGV